jgi:hypothetical protein
VSGVLASLRGSVLPHKDQTREILCDQFRFSYGTVDLFLSERMDIDKRRAEDQAVRYLELSLEDDSQSASY